MNVVITIVIVVVMALWGLATYTRLVALRTRVKDAWTRAKDDSTRQTYNTLAMSYNEALASFPGNILAAIAGFRPAGKL